MKLFVFATSLALISGPTFAAPRRLQIVSNTTRGNRTSTANATAPSPFVISTAPPNLQSIVPGPTGSPRLISSGPPGPTANGTTSTPPLQPTMSNLTSAPSAASSSTSQTTTFVPTTAMTTAPTAAGSGQGIGGTSVPSAAVGPSASAGPSVSASTPSAAGTPTSSLVTNCGCQECTAQVLDQPVSDAGGDSTCRQRIEWLMLVDEFSEQSACSRVADEFPDTCAKGCDPSEGCTPKAVTNCGCPQCTAQILDRNATDAGGTATCRARMDFIMNEYNTSEQAACARVTRELGDFCTSDCDPRICNSNETGGSAGTGAPSVVTDCGCPSTCTREVLDRDADGFSCRARIEWVITQSGLGYNQEQACTVLYKEFPTICACNPPNCTAAPPLASDVPSDVPSLAPTLSTGSIGPTLTARPTSAPSTGMSKLAVEMKAILEEQGAYDKHGDDQSEHSSARTLSSVGALVIGLVAGLAL